MKQIVPLLSLILALTPLALTPTQASAMGVKLDINADGSVQVAFGDDRKDRRKNDNGGDHHDQNDNGNGQASWRDDRGSNDNGGARDNRLDQARNIASSRGRVLDAGPLGGSRFWVRVASDRGRVDIIVDTATGRIIGER